MDDDEMELGTPPPILGRSLEVEMNQEVIAIDLDALEQDTGDVIAVLQDGNCKVSFWTQLASEYWKKGWIEAAQRIINAAVEFFRANRAEYQLPPVYLLLANIQIDSSRRAPKMKLTNPQLDRLGAETTKDQYLAEAATLMNNAAAYDTGDLYFLTRGIHQLAKQNTMQDALQTFEDILKKSPTNVIALHGKARILYAKKNYRESLLIYQRILRLSPFMQPDPRIGIGLCLWQLGDKAKAKAAWERSAELAPDSWVAQHLLGLEALNASKDPLKAEDQRQMAYAIGCKHIERSFGLNQKSAASANCLSEYFIRREEPRKALKLAERAIQYADTLGILNEGHLRAGRIAQLEGRLDDAFSHYSVAKALPLASIGIAQCHMIKEEPAAAIHILDGMMNVPESQRIPEVMIMLASLRASNRPALSSQEYAADKAKSREMFEKVKRDLKQSTAVNGATKTEQPAHGKRAELLEDMEMHLEIARLWESENSEKAVSAYQEARRISELSPRGTDPRIVNNIAVLNHLEGSVAEARVLYEESLGLLSTSWVGAENMDGMSTTVLYNLARVYEDEGELGIAKDAYEKLLSRHPEYIDAKIRLASMLSASNKINEAHEILKQALSSQGKDLNLRAYYTHFLVQATNYKAALNFVFITLRDHSKSDLYANCAAAWLHYHLARENRETAPESIRDRRHKFHSAAEFYEKALNIDPSCAIAAQGLAIMVAEDALGVMSLKSAGATVEDETVRMTNTREALDVFAKIREVLADGSVYTNMGHCYYMRDEYERAIESYETGLRRFYNGQNVSVLMCLSRTWYAKATRDQSFASMKTALKYAQDAQHIIPGDKSIRYNIAMIQQKGAEMLFSLALAKRTLDELKEGYEKASQAQRLFLALSEDKAQDSHLPYNRSMANQRQVYGAHLMRRGADQLSQQEKYEGEQRAQMDSAREFRLQERAAADAIENARLEELQRKAAELAEERKKAREEAAAYAAQAIAESSEEEKPKRKKKEKSMVVDDDADVMEGVEKEKKKPSGRRRIRKGKENHANQEDEAMFSGEDGEKLERPKKRTVKKRIVDEEEDDADKPARKKFKSNDTISDSDEELERLDRIEEEQEKLLAAAGVPPLAALVDA